MSSTIIDQRISPGSETAEAYHASGAWGSSLISTFLRSPQLAHRLRTRAWVPPSSPSQQLGTVFHALMDPGSDFVKHHQPGPRVRKNTNAWKDAESEASKNGITLMDADTWDQLHAMRDSVLANPVAAELLVGAEHEVGFRGPSPYGPFTVQCRADVLVPGRHIADFKTVSQWESFARSVVDHGYHRQAAFYRWVVELITGEKLPFVCIVVETAAPLHRCRVVDFDSDFLDLGWREVEGALRSIGERSRTNDWADHDHATVLSPPPWLVRESFTVGSAADVHADADVTSAVEAA